MISLCMIVRDEEKYIGGCLESAMPCVDEIVVVDTGSKDRTVQIAESYGARIFHYQWNDDFSSARNEALKKAKGDWILSLDADEILKPDAPQIIRRAVANNTYCGYSLPFINPVDDGQEVYCQMVRLFINNPDIRFRYLIHEQIIPDLNHYAKRTGKLLGKLDAMVVHLGYKTEAINDHNKNERNNRIFQKQLRHFPKDVYSWYKYADFLRLSDGPKDQVFKVLKRAFSLLQDTPDSIASSFSFAGEVSSYLALYYYELEHSCEKALEVLKVGASRFLPTPHLFYIKGRIEKEMNLNEEAIISFKRCLEFKKDDQLVPVTDGVTSWMSYLGLGLCHLKLNNLDRAEHYLEKSTAIQPNQIEPYAGLAEAAHKRNKPKDALKWLVKLLKQRPDYEQAWITGSSILEALGLHQQAELWKNRSSTALPKEQNIR